MNATITKPRIDFDVEVETRRDDLDADYSGWYCVSTDPWPCPAANCDFVAMHMTAAHLIVVWPANDDRMLLSFANDARRVGRGPRIVEYEPSFGPCIPFDEWVRIGRPVHGIIRRPESLPFRQL